MTCLLFEVWFSPGWCWRPPSWATAIRKFSGVGPAGQSCDLNGRPLALPSSARARPRALPYNGGRPIWRIHGQQFFFFIKISSNHKNHLATLHLWCCGNSELILWYCWYSDKLLQVAGVVQILEIGDCITVLISSASYCVDCRKLWGLVSSKLFGGIPTEDNWATCDSSLSIRLYINAIRHNLSNLLNCWLITWHISLVCPT